MQSKHGFQCEGARGSPVDETPQWHPYMIAGPRHLCVFLVPGPCQAMVSNPHSLGLQAVIYEAGYTYDGNIKHRLVSCTPAPAPGACDEGHSLDGAQPAPGSFRCSTA